MISYIVIKVFGSKVELILKKSEINDKEKKKGDDNCIFCLFLVN